MLRSNTFTRVSILALTVVMILTLMPTEAFAARKQSEAVKWATDQIDKTAYDTDGMWASQCVDFIQAYYQFLGVSGGGNNACNYAGDTRPYGFTVEEYKSGFKAQPGDIAVWTKGWGGADAGHVAVVISADSKGMYVAEQWGQDSIQGVHYNPWPDGRTIVTTIIAKVREGSYPYTGYYQGYEFWGVIHPQFEPDHKHNYDDYGNCTVCREAYQLDLKAASGIRQTVKADVPLRNSPYSPDTSIMMLPKNWTVTLKSQTENSKGNLWYKVDCFYQGKFYIDKWIFSENVVALLDTHKHDYDNYGFCKKCGMEFALVKVKTGINKSYSAVKDVVPVRKRPYSTEEVLRNLKSGASVIVSESYMNSLNNLWYKLNDGTWVYSENLKETPSTQLKEWRLHRFACPDGHASAYWNINCSICGKYVTQGSWQEKWVVANSVIEFMPSVLDSQKGYIWLNGEKWFYELNTIPSRDISPIPVPTPTPAPTPTPVPPTPVQDQGVITACGDVTINAIMTNVGTKFDWYPNNNPLGYRIYRSTSVSDEGISITDFPIMGGEYVDVNVEPHTQYYYTIRKVLSETSFDPTTMELTPEVQGSTGEALAIATEEIIEPDADAGPTKHSILMEIDNPIMITNTEALEIDPGRGTAPTIVNGRTLVPIRAIAETMGGTVGWNDATRTVSIDCMSRHVEMTLDSKIMTVDGTMQEMDIAAQTINDRTVLPVRFVGEALGCVIEWIGSTKQIIVVFYR